MERNLNLRLPFGPAPTEATIGGYRHDSSVRALHRVYSVEATLDARNAASTGMKPEEGLASHGILVAANYRPNAMKPVVAKHRGKCFTALPREGYLTLVADLKSAALRNRLSMIG